MRDFGRMLMIFGILAAIVGAFLYFGWKFPFRFGRLPGDIVHRSEHGTFYLPIVSSILLSAGLSLILWLISHLRR